MGESQTVQPKDQRSESPTGSAGPTGSDASSKVGRVTGAVAGVLRFVAGDRCDDWPDAVPPVEFALSGSASSLSEPAARPSTPTGRKFLRACQTGPGGARE